MDANNNTVKASRPPPGKDDFQKKVQLLFRMKTHGQRAELYPTLVDLLHWHMPSNDHSMETARRRLAIFREFVEYVEKATPEHMDKQYAALDAMSDEMIIILLAVIESSTTNQSHVGTILNLQAKCPRPAALVRMVAHLNAAVPLYVPEFAVSPPVPPADERELTARMIREVPEKQAIKFLLKLRQAAGLDESAVPNAIFVRKMRHLAHVFGEHLREATDDHEVFNQQLIDHPDELDGVLFPFFAATRDKNFGFDSEWDASHAGDVGTLGLLQISSIKETMLIDVTSLTKVHGFGRAEWTALFARIFAPDHVFFVFDVISDLNALLFNFPYVAETDIPASSQFVCLKTILTKASSYLNDLEYSLGLQLQADNYELYESLFEDGMPTSTNLSEVSFRLLHFTSPKTEQLSVWTSRPLRRKQLKYAATDSFLCFSIQAKLKQKISAVMSREDTLALFPTTEWPLNRAAAADVTADTPTGGKKNRSSQFSHEEVLRLIRESNEKLRAQEQPTITADERPYAADQMCGQLAALLRRCGLEVYSGWETTKIQEECLRKTNMRVLTCGKAAKNFPFAGRVLNIPASSSTLDVQLLQFLQMERVLVDEQQMHSRCARCASRWLVWLPTVALRYAHLQQAAANVEAGVHIQSFSAEDLVRAERELADFEAFHPFRHYFVDLHVDFHGFVYAAPNGLVHLDRLLVYRVDREQQLEVQQPIPLVLATHVDHAQAPTGSMHAICAMCGRENHEATIAEDREREIKWR
ncbi:Exonuclease mut-7 [Aphelenchoides fujianensis]|nr:Exonuclease mut-7 [Aphelenchoides fujianensis]